MGSDVTVKGSWQEARGVLEVLESIDGTCATRGGEWEAGEPPDELVAICEVRGS